jgi:hypothetical protein
LALPAEHEVHHDILGSKRTLRMGLKSAILERISWFAAGQDFWAGNPRLIAAQLGHFWNWMGMLVVLDGSAAQLTPARRKA